MPTLHVFTEIRRLRIKAKELSDDRQSSRMIIFFIVAAIMLVGSFLLLRKLDKPKAARVAAPKH